MQPTDAATLSRLYDRVAPHAYGLALRILGDPETAQEVLGEAFGRAARVAGRLDAEAWLLAETRRLALARPPAATSEASPSDVVALTPLAARAGAARARLQALPAMDREIVERAYFGGQTPVAIAASLDLAPDVVRRRLRLALRSLTAGETVPREEATR